MNENSVTLKSNTVEANLEDLSNDKEFEQLLTLITIDHNNIDHEKITILASKVQNEGLTEEDIKDVALGLGYPTQSDYENSVALQSRLIKSLDAKYGIGSMDGQTLQPVIIRKYEGMFPQLKLLVILVTVKEQDETTQ